MKTFIIVKIHYETTGAEIANDFEHIDAFVSAVGTGGTITGIGKRLREKFESLKIYAVEPEESQVLSGNPASPHKIQGIGAGFIPEILDTQIYSDVISVSSAQAYDMTKKIFQEEGLFLGISSGAAIYASLKVAEKMGKGKVVLTTSPDSGDRYITSNIF